jgi:hypothetical protein
VRRPLTSPNTISPTTNSVTPDNTRTVYTIIT